MPSPSLPARPNLEHLRNQAKDLLKAYRAGQPSALRRFRESSHHLSNLDDHELVRLSLSLRDAQRVVATEYGFPDWMSMRTHVERKERATMYEMTVDHLRVNKLSNQRMVILKGKEIRKSLSIWIGEAEGNAIGLKLQGQDMPRPMTHDLMDSMIRDLGATVSRVVVSEMSGETFLANVELQTNDTTLELDSRPSDAIALAVRCGAPVFVAADVLEQVGTDLDSETDEPTPTITQWPPEFPDVTDNRLFSERAQSVLKQAGLEASQLGHEEIEPEDMLLALVAESEGIGARALTDLGVDLGAIRSMIQDQAGGGESSSDSPPELGERSKRVVRLAMMGGSLLFNSRVSTGHLLMGFVLADDGLASAVLKESGIEIEAVREGVIEALAVIGEAEE